MVIELSADKIDETYLKYDTFHYNSERTTNFITIVKCQRLSRDMEHKKYLEQNKNWATVN